MIANSGQIRERLVTLDYSHEDSSALLLARPRPAAAAIDGINKLIERVVVRERRKRINVPRMSMLIRFEEEHERRLQRVRRQFLLLLAVLVVAFLIGLVAGVSVRTPQSVRPAVTSMRNTAGRALSAAVSTTEISWQRMLGNER